MDLLLCCNATEKPPQKPEPVFQQTVIKPAGVAVPWSQLAAPGKAAPAPAEAKRSKSDASLPSSSSSSSSSAAVESEEAQLGDSKDSDGDALMQQAPAAPPAHAVAPARAQSGKRKRAASSDLSPEEKKAQKRAKDQVYRKAAKAKLAPVREMHAKLLSDSAPPGVNFAAYFNDNLPQFRVHCAVLKAAWGRPAAESPLVDVCLLCDVKSPGDPSAIDELSHRPADKYFNVQGLGGHSNYYRHIREHHGKQGDAIWKRIYEFENQGSCTTPLPDGIPAENCFRPAVTVSCDAAPDRYEPPHDPDADPKTFLSKMAAAKSAKLDLRFLKKSSAASASKKKRKGSSVPAVKPGRVKIRPDSPEVESSVQLPA